MVALQNYAAMTGSSIITNEMVYNCVAAAPRHRLMPVDVLSQRLQLVRAMSHNSDKLMVQPPEDPSEIVHECVVCLDPMADREWMC